MCSERAEKHGLYLIPNGTVHCAGIDKLVFEISATPYIFTLKMYDWMPLDLDGSPRTLNLDRAFENLDFSHKGRRIPAEFVSHPRVIEQDSTWQVVHRPTHAEHFYDVHRLEFGQVIDVATEGSPHILSLVEGTEVVLELPDGERVNFHYAETFCIPAATGHYRLISPDDKPLKVVKALLKPIGAAQTAR